MFCINSLVISFLFFFFLSLFLTITSLNSIFFPQKSVFISRNIPKPQVKLTGNKDNSREAYKQGTVRNKLKVLKK